MQQQQMTLFGSNETEPTLPSIAELIEQGFLFVLNHSGGKDSQAMYLKLRDLVPAKQLIVVHAILHRVDWPGIDYHIESTVNHPVFYVAAGKSLFDMVEQRGMWPSPQYRQCTSDLKRGPVETFIRRYLLLHPEFSGRVVNCMGATCRGEQPTRQTRRQDPHQK